MPKFLTKLRKAIITVPVRQVIKIINHNPGIVRAAGAIVAASCPGGGSSTVAIGASLGSGIEAAAQHRHFHQIQKEGERKIEAQRIEQQTDLDAQFAVLEKQFSTEKSNITAGIKEITTTTDLAMSAIKQEEAQLVKKEEMMTQILDHIRQRQLKDAEEKLKQLDNESYETLVGIINEILHPEDKKPFAEFQVGIENSKPASTSSSSLK